MLTCSMWAIKCKYKSYEIGGGWVNTGSYYHSSVFENVLIWVFVSDVPTGLFHYG